MLHTHPVICCLLFVAVACLVYLLGGVCNTQRMRVRRRVRSVGRSVADQSPDDSVAAWQRAKGLAAKLADLEYLRLGSQLGRTRVSQRLAEAGVFDTSMVPLFLAAKLGLAVSLGAVAGVCGFLFHVPVQATAALVGVLACAGLAVPHLAIRWAIVKRRRRIERGLPDFLDITTVCLSGGLGMQDALRRVADELRIAQPALAEELKVVQHDIELGGTLDQALFKLASRCRCEGLRTFAAFVRESRRLGTSLTEALRSHADALRQQRERRAEERAQKAAVKILLPTLLLIFPAVFIVLVMPAVFQIKQAFLNQ